MLIYAKTKQKGSVIPQISISIRYWIDFIHSTELNWTQLELRIAVRIILID